VGPPHDDGRRRCDEQHDAYSDGRRLGVPDADAFADAHAFPDTDADTDAFTHAHTFTDAHAFADAHVSVHALGDDVHVRLAGLGRRGG
jgi:hypothetical protein